MNIFKTPNPYLRDFKTFYANEILNYRLVSKSCCKEVDQFCKNWIGHYRAHAKEEMSNKLLSWEKDEQKSISAGFVKLYYSCNWGREIARRILSLNPIEYKISTTIKERGIYEFGLVKKTLYVNAYDKNGPPESENNVNSLYSNKKINNQLIMSFLNKGIDNQTQIYKLADLRSNKILFTLQITGLNKDAWHFVNTGTDCFIYQTSLDNTHTYLASFKTNQRKELKQLDINFVNEKTSTEVKLFKIEGRILACGHGFFVNEVRSRLVNEILFFNIKNLKSQSIKKKLNIKMATAFFSIDMKKIDSMQSKPLDGLRIISNNAFLFINSQNHLCKYEIGKGKLTTYAFFEIPNLMCVDVLGETIFVINSTGKIAIIDQEIGDGPIFANLKFENANKDYANLHFNGYQMVYDMPSKFDHLHVFGDLHIKNERMSKDAVQEKNEIEILAKSNVTDKTIVNEPIIDLKSPSENRSSEMSKSKDEGDLKNSKKLNSSAGKSKELKIGIEKFNDVAKVNSKNVEKRVSFDVSDQDESEHVTSIEVKMEQYKWKLLSWKSAGTIVLLTCETAIFTFGMIALFASLHYPVGALSLLSHVTVLGSSFWIVGALGAIALTATLVHKYKIFKTRINYRFYRNH